jgi:hypothetical protein
MNKEYCGNWIKLDKYIKIEGSEIWEWETAGEKKKGGRRREKGER